MQGYLTTYFFNTSNILIMEIVNHVYMTNDYAKFNYLNGNRNVNKLHVKRLSESLTKNQLISVAIVNKNFEVIDGQHRLEVCKQNNLPFYFIICEDYGLDETQILNVNMKNWQKKDYLKGYCDLGYSEYIKFRKFMKEYPEFEFASCEILLTNSLTGGHKSTSSSDMKGVINKSGSFAVKYFQDGELQIPDYQQSVDNAEKIKMMQKYFSLYNSTLFVRTMVGLFKLPHYDHSRMLQKLSYQPMSLQQCSNITQYKLLLEDIYNYKSRDGDRYSLRF